MKKNGSQSGSKINSNFAIFLLHCPEKTQYLLFLTRKTVSFVKLLNSKRYILAVTCIVVEISSIFFKLSITVIPFEIECILPEADSEDAFPMHSLSDLFS